MRDEQEIKDGLIFDFSCFFGIVLVFRGFFVCLFFLFVFFSGKRLPIKALPRL